MQRQLLLLVTIGLTGVWTMGCGREVGNTDVAPSSAREDSLAGMVTQLNTELSALRAEARGLRARMAVAERAAGGAAPRDDSAPTATDAAASRPASASSESAVALDAAITKVLLRFPGMNNSKVTYVGESRDGQAEGIGYALWSTGSAYEGQWHANRRHGEGRHWYPDGARYEGTYQSDKREGYGTYFYRNGQRWEGPWQENLRHGEGILYEADGRVRVRGIWERDRLVREIKP
jgi:hypothetical protein